MTKTISMHVWQRAGNRKISTGKEMMHLDVYNSEQMKQVQMMMSSAYLGIQ